ncbi:NADH:flavin oxidoreductase [Polyangium sp. 6x1]|uniref:NADH:flavin oxidoreductase n=1 Tax=Polyangium sp. 6x1 TaxID=3042689 RepID=UPI002482915F|nr:NADH:flavin oxidoreductase [Polyangium sp. 6x1]MDI1447935.1 NADH:flavin oxidoreductase [Polyangium sp. 6x1]
MASKDLFEPLAFRNGRTARNRIALAPMTNQQSHADGTLSDEELHWLALRAEGGFGIVATCAAHVTRDGQGWPGELGIYDDKLLPGLTRLATALRDRGALSIVQIFHGGARADTSVTGERPWSASELEGDAANPRAATREDIERVIAAFRDAAVRAHRAGFDGVQLHGAHGYLLGQFLSATGNKRDDAYGGSFENRARLLREATRAARAAVPASFLVGVRISPEDWGQAKGLDLDENLTLTRWLAEDGIDFLGVSLWDSFANTKKRPDVHPIPIFRHALPADVPLFVAGKIWTRAEAEALLELGADGVSLARSAILNPDWPLRARDATWEPRRPPMAAAELLERGLSPKFVDYMRRWKGFVAD